MLLKSFASAALLLTTVISSPLSISLEIKDDLLEPHQAPFLHITKENPGKGGTVGPVKKAIDELVKQASTISGYIEKLEPDNVDSVLGIVKALYIQYETLNSSISANPSEKFSDRAGDAVVKYFYDLTQGLKAEFETVVEKKDTILTYGKLDILLGEDIKILEGGWIDYNDALYGLLPTDQQKEDFTDYSSGVSSAIASAKDALVVEGKHHTNEHRLEL